MWEIFVWLLRKWREIDKKMEENFELFEIVLVSFYLEEVGENGEFWLIEV